MICIKCREDFEGISALSHHIVAVHCRRTDDLAYTFKLCYECDLTFESKKLLRRHNKSIHEGIKSAVCELCAKQFRDNFGLKRHTKEKHKNGSAIEKKGSNL